MSLDSEIRYFSFCLFEETEKVQRTQDFQHRSTAHFHWWSQCADQNLTSWWSRWGPNHWNKEYPILIAKMIYWLFGCFDIIDNKKISRSQFWKKIIFKKCLRATNFDPLPSLIIWNGQTKLQWDVLDVSRGIYHRCFFLLVKLLNFHQFGPSFVVKARFFAGSAISFAVKSIISYRNQPTKDLGVPAQWTELAPGQTFNPNIPGGTNLYILYI